ncbi:MAG: Uma2 family endonuclease [Chloroflexota bacterium]
MLNEKQRESIPETEIIEVNLEDYLETYAERGYEWVDGKAIKLAPIGLRHEKIRDYLKDLLRIYFISNPIGIVLAEPFMMLMPKVPNRRREPDLMIVLNSNPNELKETYMDGPADICIEIVSQGSVSVDHGAKFEEYAKGGVREYWIIDPIRNECRFYQLDKDGVYQPQAKDGTVYQTSQLPNLVIDTDVLWKDELPNVIEVVEIVKDMLNEKDK